MTTSRPRTDNAEHEEQLRALARAICRRGLAAPAVFFLELYKPMTGLCLAGATMCAPLCAALVGARRVDRALGLLESREAVERLLMLIEETAKEATAQAHDCGN